MADKLNAGDQFPEMTLGLVGGDSVTVPTSKTSNYQIVLIYRAHW